MNRIDLCLATTVNEVIPGAPYLEERSSVAVLHDKAPLSGQRVDLHHERRAVQVTDQLADARPLFSGQAPGERLSHGTTIGALEQFLSSLVSHGAFDRFAKC